MRNQFSVLFLLLCLALMAPPAFCQEGSYQNYLVPMPTADELNVSAQPANQYYNPVQQQGQFNQMVMPTQVPYAQGGQYAGQPMGNDFGYQQQTYVNQTQTPQGMSAYQQQEAAIAQAQMAQQLEEARHSKESEQSFRMSGEVNDKVNDSYDPNKKSKGKSVANGMGRIVKGATRFATPIAGTVGSFYLLRAAFGNNMMAMPVPGGMMLAPRP